MRLKRTGIVTHRAAFLRSREADEVNFFVRTV